MPKRNKDNHKNYQSSFERLLIIKKYLEDYSSPQNAVRKNDIHNYLKGLDDPIIISDNTLFSDIKALNDSAVVKIVYDRKQKGYYVDNRLFDTYELRVLVDSVQAAKFITQKQANTLSNKIKQMADVSSRKYLERQALVGDRTHSQNESIVKGSDKLYEAIAANVKVSFRYFHYSPELAIERKKSYSKKGEPYIVSPFLLLWNEGYYYLYAYDSNSKKFRHFRVDRMENLQVLLGEQREGNREYDKLNKRDYQKTLFNMFDGEDKRITLRCYKGLADVIIDRFGNNVMLVPEGKDFFTVNVNVRLSEPFYAWVCSFGRRLKVIGPPEVVQKTKEYAQKVYQLYENETGK